MYYLMMKTSVNADLRSKTFCVSKSYIRLKKKETSLVNTKFYQKVFVIIISLSTMLIFPESPKELQNICKRYNTIYLCNVW